jgi:hypothetical protein
MSNFVIQRIQRQINVNTPAPVVVAESVYELSPPVPADELYLLFVKEFTQEIPKVMEANKEIGFGNIYDFVAWYVENKKHFSAAQQVPLDTLIQTRDMVFQGCNCKQQQRDYAANEYFKTFWSNNVSTDIMPTLLKATNASVVKIGNFLVYPVV